MKKLKVVFFILAAIFLIWKIMGWYSSFKKDDNAEKLRREVIKNSQLIKINEGLYSKIAADTLTIKQLKKLSDSLELELKNPQIVTEIRIEYKYIEKPVDSISIQDSILYVEDNYPNKENAFISYKSDINLITGKGTGAFDIKPQELFLGIGHNEDGTYSINSKVPEYINITGLEVKSLPLTKEKPDNFGWLLGVKGGKDFLNSNNLYGVSGGIRYKKFYIDTDVLVGNDNVMGLLGFKLEF